MIPILLNIDCAIIMTFIVSLPYYLITRNLNSGAVNNFKKLAIFLGLWFVTAILLIGPLSSLIYEKDFSRIFR
ncbi:hypothetical protein KKB40_05180 [Patescibacteria group bacterium]|nr:hypothetical protein [Patescibacteria group bacterium]